MTKKINQKKIWDKVYAEKTLMTGDRVQSSLMHFIKFLKKTWKKQGRSNEFGESALMGKTFLDLGAGEGKNSIFIAKAGGVVTAIELSSEACKNFSHKLSENNSILEKEIDVVQGKISLERGSMAMNEEDFLEKYKINKDSFDVVLDVTSSNALNKEERENYLKNVESVLKKDGYFFVRVPAKDDNAKKMITSFPAFSKTREENSYIMPKLGLTETVFTEDTFRSNYEKYFKIIKFSKEKHYTKVDGKVYKRFFIIAYLVKK